MAQAFSDAEVIAIATAAPALRYGHARARSLGTDNIRYGQANAKDVTLSRWLSRLGADDDVPA